MTKITVNVFARTFLYNIVYYCPRIDATPCGLIQVSRSMLQHFSMIM